MVCNHEKSVLIKSAPTAQYAFSINRNTHLQQQHKKGSLFHSIICFSITQSIASFNLPKKAEKTSSVKNIDKQQLMTLLGVVDSGKNDGEHYSTSTLRHLHLACSLVLHSFEIGDGCPSLFNWALCPLVIACVELDLVTEFCEQQ